MATTESITVHPALMTILPEPLPPVVQHTDQCIHQTAGLFHRPFFVLPDELADILMYICLHVPADKKIDELPEGTIGTRFHQGAITIPHKGQNVLIREALDVIIASIGLTLKEYPDKKFVTSLFTGAVNQSPLSGIVATNWTLHVSMRLA